MTPLLTITDLHITIAEKPIVNGISLTINEDEIHAIMGPNGSGKSTLVNTLMGHPSYTITNGSVEFQGKNLLEMSTDERAKAGLFLAFQYPRSITGITLRSFLFAAHKACHPDVKNLHSPVQFKKHLEGIMHKLHMDPSLCERDLNEGFSGGEKKKAEILQLNVLKPVLSLLDETDSGLDIDALKIVTEGIKNLPATPTCAPASLIVTHYARILHHLQPDFVHVMKDGKILESGGKDLAEQLEKGGYEAYN